MIFSLLNRVSPDNIPGAYVRADATPIVVITLTVFAIILTIISASLIYYFWKHTNSETLPYKNGVGIGIIIVSLVIIAVFILTACFAFRD